MYTKKECPFEPSGLTAGRKSIFIVRPNDWTILEQGHYFWWVQAQGSQNTLVPVDIPQKSIH